MADPFKAHFWLLLLFYVCLAGFLQSTFTLALYSVRGRKIDSIHAASQLKISIRQAFWLTLLVIGSLILSATQLLFWWLEIIFILMLVMIEGYCLSSNS
jgi:4-hydroxybenzoate polyprenyltransferase